MLVLPVVPVFPVVVLADPVVVPFVVPVVVPVEPVVVVAELLVAAELLLDDWAAVDLPNCNVITLTWLDPLSTGSATFSFLPPT